MKQDPFAPSPPTSPSAIPRLRPPRRPRTEEKLTSFSFVSSYSVVEKDSNPLITGDLKDFEADGAGSEELRSKAQMHLDLQDLVTAKKAFEEDGVEGSTGKDLTLEQFVAAFSGLVGSAMRQQLGYLFMKIDCDCDGHVSWDELLSFVMSQNRNVSSSDLVDRQCAPSPPLRACSSGTRFLPRPHPLLAVPAAPLVS